MHCGNIEIQQLTFLVMISILIPVDGFPRYVSNELTDRIKINTEYIRIKTIKNDNRLVIFNYCRFPV